MQARWLLPFTAAAIASFGVVGADARWYCAVGAIVAHGHLPSSLPFATAPTHWHDATALGQLVFHAAGTGRGLVVLQALAAGIGFATLRSLPVGLLVAAGSLPTLLITRSSLFSLALFPLLLLLLERGERLWLAVPLIALWANLYGGALVGWALLAVYVVLAARRAWPVLAAATVALCATPVLWETPSYYAGVAGNEAAKQGAGLWAGLSLNAFDAMLVVVAVALIVAGARSFRLWEAVACAGLALATVHAARLGVWLLFVAAHPAARAAASRWVVPRAALVVPVALIPVGLALSAREDAGALARVAADSNRPVLADAIAAEQVAALGGRVWVANPLDAFARADQRLYLDWLRGRGDAAVEHARLVLVLRHSDVGRASERDRRLRVVTRNDRYALYRVAR